MLGGDVAAALPGLRAEAESRMAEQVMVGEFAAVTDPETGDAVFTLVEERYSGKGRLRWASREVQNTVGPSMPVKVQEPYLSVPFGSVRFEVGDMVVCSGSPDPLLVGRRFRVEGEPVAGQVSAYRYPLTEVVSRG